MPTRARIKEIEEIRDPYPADFAGRLRAFRKERKIKQTEFAEKLGIDIQKCRRYEKTNSEQEASPAEHTAIKKSPKKGKSPEPDVETLKNMASILNITVDELIGYKPATINIATGILTKAGIAFKKDKDEDTYVLYRYKTKEESDAYYEDYYTGEYLADEDHDPGLYEVFIRDFYCSFDQIPSKYGFRVFSGEEAYCPVLPENSKDLQCFTYLNLHEALSALANEDMQNIKVFYNYYNGTYESRNTEEFLSNVKMIIITSAEMKACVFEAKRRTDALIKSALNAVYAAFYPTVFWNYISNEKYSKWSVESIDLLPKEFSERLRKLREMKNCSQTEMANKVGLSLQTYNRYETQGAQPSIVMLKKLASELGISVDSLTGFKMDYINKALDFLKKVHITCIPENESNQYYVQVPGREPKKSNGKSLQCCAYTAKTDVDKLIATSLKHIFNNTFTPIFWELVNQHRDSTLGIIIDENDYEPYLFELKLMNKPE